MNKPNASAEDDLQSNVTSSPRSNATTKQRQSPGRRWSFRIAAMLLGLLPLLAVELGLRLLDLPKEREAAEPWIAFQTVKPLFVPDESGETMQTAANRIDIFRRDTFAARKRPDEFRVFVLGGSTVQGRPYAIETSFTTWLELSLTASDPTRSWQVVNCGGVSYASYRLIPILEEVLGYDPDLIIVYSGHNEFLEERTYADYKAASSWRRGSHEVASQLRLYRVIRQAWLRASTASVTEEDELDVLPGEVLARLDFEDGLELFERDESWRDAVEAHYEANLREMVRLCRGRDVPLLFCDPVENLRDCAPFKSAFSPATRSDARTEILERLEAARGSLDAVDASLSLEQSLLLDPSYALSHYWLASSYDRMGEFEKAKAAYIRAKDEDICPLRMREPMHRSLTRVCQQLDVPCVDIRQKFTEISPQGIPDQTWLLDHVHPTIKGHQQIAIWLKEKMAELGWLTLRSGWESRQAALYEKHLQTLDTAYYTHGQDRLRSLLEWTKGRAYNAFPRENRNSLLESDLLPPTAEEEKDR